MCGVVTSEAQILNKLTERMKQEQAKDGEVKVVSDYKKLKIGEQWW